MKNLARPLTVSAHAGYRPARSVRPASTAVAEARQRHLSLVHAGTPLAGRRFDDPVVQRPGFVRRMKALGALLAVAAVVVMLAAA